MSSTVVIPSIPQNMELDVNWVICGNNLNDIVESLQKVTNKYLREGWSIHAIEHSPAYLVGNREVFERYTVYAIRPYK